MVGPGGKTYWQHTMGLASLMLGLCILFGFAVHAIVGTLNGVALLGFPIGFYMAAQGSVIAFVFMLFWFSRRQNAIDEKHDMAED